MLPEQEIADRPVGAMLVKDSINWQRIRMLSEGSGGTRLPLIHGLITSLDSFPNSNSSLTPSPRSGRR